MSIRLRVSGSDNSTSNYSRQYILASSTTVSSARSSAQTSWGIASLNTSKKLDIFEFHYPFNSAETSLIQTSNLNYSDGANTSWLEQSAGFTASTSFTGFSLIAGSGSFTGTATIFGYNK